MTENTVCVTTKTVQKAIERYVAERCVEHFTTADIALFMGVEEYPVRAALPCCSGRRMAHASAIKIAWMITIGWKE
jgi:hypothetical protein